MSPPGQKAGRKRENARLGEVADVAQRFESAMDLRGGSRLAVGTERQGGMKCTHGDHRKGQVERLEEEQDSVSGKWDISSCRERARKQAYAQYIVPVSPCVNQDNRQSTKSIGYAPSRSRIVERLEPWRAA